MTDRSLVFNPLQMQVWTTQAHTQALSQSAPSPHPASADETSWSFRGPSLCLCSKKEVVPGSLPSRLHPGEDTGHRPPGRTCPQTLGCHPWDSTHTGPRSHVETARPGRVGGRAGLGSASGDPFHLFHVLRCHLKCHLKRRAVLLE